MPRLTWSPASRDDLRTISDWLMERDGDVASRTLRAIRFSANRLVDYPPIGRAVNEPFRVLGVRSVPYVIVYRLRDEGIEIIRVRHARENWLPVEGDI